MFQGMHYVYAVYKEMNFSRAAKSLYISQPSLSAAVKKEEERVGFQIFDRSTSPITLTEPGAEYIRSVEAILSVEEGFQQYLNDLNRMQTGSLAIGGTHLFASYILPPYVSLFTEAFPKVHLDMVEGNSSRLAEKLQANVLDLLMDYKNPGPSFERRFFCKEEILLTVPRSFATNEGLEEYAFTAADIKAGKHRGEDVSPVPLHAFENDPFLLLKSGNHTRRRAKKICADNRFMPKIKLELDQQVTGYNLSGYGMGISFNGDLLISRVPDNPGLVFYKLDSKQAIRNINVYYRKNRYIPKAMEEFLTLLDTEETLSGIR